MYGTLNGVARLFDIEVTGDVKGVSKMDSRLLLASARAIDDTGKFAQSEVIRELDDEFVLRGNWYRPKTRYGINFIPTQSGNLTGLLYTRADWLLEEEGYNRGVKTPTAGREHLADPEDPVTRGPITRKFPVAQKAGRLLANAGGRISPKTGKLIGKTGAFIIRPKGKPGIEYVFQRVGLTKAGDVRRNKQGVPLRGRVARGNSRLILKHILKKSVKVDRPMIIQKTTRNVYRVWYGEYFNRNIRLALATAK